MNRRDSADYITSSHPQTCVLLGGGTLVGPMGRGVPREEPAVHVAGRQPAGRVRRVDLEGTVAGPVQDVVAFAPVGWAVAAGQQSIGRVHALP